MIGPGDLLSKRKQDYLNFFDPVISPLIAVLYPLTAVTFRELTRWTAVPLPGVIDPAAAFLIPLALTFGLPVATGAFGGSLLVAFLNSSIAVQTLFFSMGQFYLAFAAVQNWNPPDELWSNEWNLCVLSTLLRKYVIITALASGGAAAIVGWGAEVGSVAPFFFIAALTFLVVLTINLIVGFPIFFVVISLGKQFRLRFGTPNQPRNQKTAYLTGVVTLAWLVFGSVGSMGYRVFNRVPPGIIESEFTFLSPFHRVEILGAGAARIQVFFGAMMFSLLICSYWWKSY